MSTKNSSDTIGNFFFFYVPMSLFHSEHLQFMLSCTTNVDTRHYLCTACLSVCITYQGPLTCATWRCGRETSTVLFVLGTLCWLYFPIQCCSSWEAFPDNRPWLSVSSLVLALTIQAPSFHLLVSFASCLLTSGSFLDLCFGLGMRMSFARWSMLSSSPRLGYSSLSLDPFH